MADTNTPAGGLSRRQALLQGAVWSAAALAALKADAASPATTASAEQTAGPTNTIPPAVGTKTSPSDAPTTFVSLRDLTRLAPAQMSAAAWEFISSGAGDEFTVRWNEEAFQALRLRPRMLRDVSTLDTRVTLLGRQLAHPILLSPTSEHQLVNPEAELATARGAGAAEATMVVSSFAFKPIEEIAKVATQPLWHATYIMKDRGRTLDLLHRAEAAGFEAICIPIDSPAVGARDREHRTYRFKDAKPVSFAEHPANYWRYPALWSDIEWMRGQTKLPLVVKGILTPEDAEQAIASGVSAIFVSNHGGRNLDTLPATIEVLPEIAAKVGGRVPIVLDGGIRRGTDVLKALAHGATAVGVGRPYLYGLALGGAKGVSAVVNILRNELEMAMALVGCDSVARLDETVFWAGASGR